MQNRAWRQTIGTSGTREIYDTDGGTSASDLNLKLPTLVRGFQFTVPAGTFDAGPTGALTVALVKIKTTYMFSQRRTDIGLLIQTETERVREEERAKLLREAADEKSLAVMMKPEPQTEEIAYPVIYGPVHGLAKAIGKM